MFVKLKILTLSTYQQPVRESCVSRSVVCTLQTRCIYTFCKYRYIRRYVVCTLQIRCIYTFREQCKIMISVVCTLQIRCIYTFVLFFLADTLLYVPFKFDVSTPNLSIVNTEYPLYVPFKFDVSTPHPRGILRMKRRILHKWPNALTLRPYNRPGELL